MTKATNCLSNITAVGSLLLLTAGAALAGGWNGPQPGTITGGNIFSYGPNPGEIVVQMNGTTNLSVPNSGYNGQLLAIDGIWIVDSAGNTLSSPPVASSNTLTGPGTGVWTAASGPAGFEGTNWGSSGGKGNFVQLSTATQLLSGSGKNFQGYSKGDFVFSNLPTSYYIGVDYLIANGSNGYTGRAYFAAPSSVTSTPEPGSVAAFAFTGLGMMGLMLRARKVRGGMTV